MNVSELMSFFYSAVFGAKRRRVLRVIEAIKEYEESPNSVACRLELESAFFDAYKKKASAPVVMKMASSPLGPFEAFDAYSRSSLFISCDYAGESISVHPRARSGLLHELLSTFFGMVVLIISFGFVLFGGYVIFGLMRLLVGLDLELFFSMSFQDLLEILFPLIFGPVLLILGCLFLWLSIKLLVVDRTSAAVKMADSIRENRN